MKSKQKIIKRVKKLLAMAGDASSPEEAMIAARQARALMDRHEIKKEDIKEDVEFGSMFAGKPMQRPPKWKEYLSVSVANYNDCVTKYQWDPDMENSRDVFCGFKADAIVAAHMFDYLCDTIERMCNQRKIKGRGARFQYKLSFSNRVSLRLRSATAERETVHKNISGQSLVVIKSSLVRQHFSDVKYSEDSYKPRAPTQDEIDAYMQGVKDGSSISLDKQVESKSSGSISLSHSS